MEKEIIPLGIQVQIQSIGPYDSYYSRKNLLEGQKGVVGPSDFLRLSQRGFYSGSIAIKGTPYYFYQVSVTLFETNCTETPKLHEEKDAPVTTESLPPGTQIRIIGISPEDNYYNQRALLLNKAGMVSSIPLSSSGKSKTGTTYFRGIITIEGRKYYPYQWTLTIVKAL